jgi:hypothetical protein
MSYFISSKPFIISHVLFLIPCTFNVPLSIVFLRRLCRRKLQLSGLFPMGIFANLFSDDQGAGLQNQLPNLGEQVIFGQGFLPLALDTPASNSKEAAAFLFRPGILFHWYLPCLACNPLSATRGGARLKTSNSSRDDDDDDDNNDNNNNNNNNNVVSLIT